MLVRVIERACTQAHIHADGMAGLCDRWDASCAGSVAFSRTFWRIMRMQGAHSSAHSGASDKRWGALPRVFRIIWQTFEGLYERAGASCIFDRAHPRERPHVVCEHSAASREHSRALVRLWGIVRTFGQAGTAGCRLGNVPNHCVYVRALPRNHSHVVLARSDEPS